VEDHEITFELKSLQLQNGRLVGLFTFEARTNVFLFGFGPPDEARFASHGARFFMDSQAGWMELPVYYDGMLDRFEFASNSPFLLELDLSPLLKLPPASRPVYVQMEDFKSTPFVFWPMEVDVTE